jgi:hypothetical protein
MRCSNFSTTKEKKSNNNGKANALDVSKQQGII